MNFPGSRSPRLVFAAVLLLAASALAWRFLIPSHSRAPRNETGSVSAGTNDSPSASARSELGERLQKLSGEGVEAQPQVRKLISEMSNAELLAALESLWRDGPPEKDRELAVQLLRRWAEEMPHAATQWISAKPPSEAQHDGLISAAIVWANSNLNDAAQWARQLPPEQKDAALVAIAYEAARAAPREALWLASELPGNQARDDLINFAVNQWTGSDTNAPLAWARQLPPSALREQVFGNLSVTLSESDPGAASELALRELPAGSRQENAVVSIVQRWTQQDPARAAEWVSRFPEGRLRQNALENLVQLWAGQSPEQAAGWLESLEEGRMRDVALAAYSNRLAGSAPATAVAWAESIQDPEHRRRELEMIAERWLSIDEEGALAWLQTASLPRNSKERLMNRKSVSAD